MADCRACCSAVNGTGGFAGGGAASQTANLQEWQNSAGTVLASVDATALYMNLATQNATLRFGNTVGEPAIQSLASQGLRMQLSGGGTLTIKDGSSQILATFIHAGGGTLRNTGTTRIEWNATGIGFFAVAPVARPTSVPIADALESLGLGATLDTASDILASQVFA